MNRQEVMFIAKVIQATIHTHPCLSHSDKLAGIVCDFVQEIQEQSSLTLMDLEEEEIDGGFAEPVVVEKETIGEEPAPTQTPTIQVGYNLSAAISTLDIEQTYTRKNAHPEFEFKYKTIICDADSTEIRKNIAERKNDAAGVISEWMGVVIGKFGWDGDQWDIENRITVYHD